jgi:hypothetical protein
MLLVIWQYATRGYRLVDRDIEKRIIPTLTKVMLIGPAIMLISVVLERFIAVAGLLGFVAVAFMIIVTAYGRFRPVERRTEVPKQA